MPVMLLDIIGPKPIPHSARFSREEFERIKRGFQSRVMEEKWTIQYVSPYLNLHRSWTGICIYSLEFAEDDDGAKVAEATCAAEYLKKHAPEYHAELVEFLIGNILLGRDLPFPMPAEIPSGTRDLYQHAISGTGYPEKISDDDRAKKPPKNGGQSN